MSCRVSNAFRLLGSGELNASIGELKKKESVSNAFRLLGSGEQLYDFLEAGELPSLKCLSAFGFWGTPHAGGNRAARGPSQMPFGFWVLGNL